MKRHKVEITEKSFIADKHTIYKCRCRRFHFRMLQRCSKFAFDAYITLTNRGLVGTAGFSWTLAAAQMILATRSISDSRGVS